MCQATMRQVFLFFTIFKEESKPTKKNSSTTCGQGLSFFIRVRQKSSVVGTVAVEVLSETNTKKEMDAKLKRYFEAGVKLVWYVDPKSRSAVAYTAPTDATQIGPDGELNGGDVLPGFSLSLPWLFEEADRQGPKKTGDA